MFSLTLTFVSLASNGFFSQISKLVRPAQWITKSGWICLKSEDNLDKSLDRTSCTFFKGNLFEANYPDNYFSAIYTDSVLEHIDKPMTILKEFYRILKPNGLVFLIVPNEDSLINDMKKILYTLLFNKSKYGRIKPFVPPYHINGFNKMSLEYAIKLNGFTVIDLAQFGGNYTFWKARRKFSKSYFFELLLYPLGLISIDIFFNAFTSPKLLEIFAKEYFPRTVE